MSASWSIRHWPKDAGFHCFLSHCAENRDSLVLPVFHRLIEQGLIPWIDEHHYPLATDSFHALRSRMLLCRHVIYFITPQLLRQGRGWCAAERVYAELIQSHLRSPGRELWSFELPLVFLQNRSDERLLRSTYSSLVAGQGNYCPYPLSQRRRCIDWSARQIARLVQQQYADQQFLFDVVEADSDLRNHLDRMPGLRQRLLSSAPDRLLIPS